MELVMISGFGCGIIGFAALALFDLNLTTHNNDRLETLYAVGAGFIMLAVLQDLPTGTSTLPGVVRIITGVLAAVFLVLLFYTCFLYGNRSKWRREEREDRTHPWYERKLADKGIFALCRHPAAWLNVLFFLCLRAAVGFPYLQTVAYSIFGIVLALFEDKLVFPRIVPGYISYKQTTPCFFPNRASAARCRETWNKK